MNPDKINRTICTGKKYTGQNIPNQLRTSYTFACQKLLPDVATGKMIEEKNSFCISGTNSNSKSR